MIYLDNAATSYWKPDSVVQAVSRAMRYMGNPGRGVHEASLSSARMMFETRRKLAGFFGAEGPEQVAFTANSTAGLNLAIQGLLRSGDQAITTACEHNSVLRPLYRLEGQGVNLRILDADGLGRIDYGRLKEWMAETAAQPSADCRPSRVMVCTHASNLTGNVFDIPRIGRLCKAYGYLLVVDASQTAGTFPIDMMGMGIDVLCFTGHKGMMGPQGIGGVCVRKGLAIRPFLVGGSGVHSYLRTQPEDMPDVLEAGTQNGPGIAGLSAAVDYILQQGQDRIRRREQGLARRFYEQVRRIPGVRIYGDFELGGPGGPDGRDIHDGDGGQDGNGRPDWERAPIVSLNIGSMDSSEAADLLDREYGIAVRAGAHCAPLMHRALGTMDQGAVRFSFAWHNTEHEADTAARAVRELAAGFRG